MSDEQVDELEREDESERTERREFLKKAGKVAASVPVATLLMSASAKPSRAWGGYHDGSTYDSWYDSDYLKRWLDWFQSHYGDDD